MRHKGTGLRAFLHWTLVKRNSANGISGHVNYRYYEQVQGLTRSQLSATYEHSKNGKIMIYRIGNTSLFVTLLFITTGTLADQFTRAFTLSPFVFVAVWALLLITALAVWFLLLASERTYHLPELTEISGSARKRIAIVSAFIPALAILIGTVSPGLPAATIAVLTTVLIIIGAGFAWTLRESGQPQGEPTRANWFTRANGITLAICAGVAAIAAGITYVPNNDDHYYLNIATYIYERGVIPTGDTVLSNQDFRTYARSSSWEVMWGSFSRLIHVHPATLLYIYWVPIAAALSIFALAKLLEGFNIRHLKTALITSTLFLVLDGANRYSFGNSQASHIWQGKAVYLALILPLTFSYTIRILTNFSTRLAFYLTALTIASVGATPTVFITSVPILSAGLFIALVNRQRKAFYAILIQVSYLVIAGLLFKYARAHNVSPKIVTSTDNSPDIYFISPPTQKFMPSSYDLLHEIAHPIPYACVLAIAIVLGWLSIRVSNARTLIALCFGFFGILVLPGIHEFALSNTGSSSIGWRFLWLLPLPALVGATSSTLVSGVSRVTASTTWTNLGLAGAWIALVAVVPLSTGLVPWKIPSWEKGEAYVANPTHWRTYKGAAETLKVLDVIAEQGDIVLAPIGISSSLAATTTKVYTVAPRDDYVRHALASLQNEFPEHRIQIAKWVDGDIQIGITPENIATSISLVRVNIVCLKPEMQKQFVPWLRAMGYVHDGRINFSHSKKYMWCGRTEKFNK